MKNIRHYIIAKFKPEYTHEDISRMLPDIKSIFDETLAIDGIKSVTVSRNCIDRDNRYDVMIEIEMAEDALKEYDASEPHKRWKQEYGDMLEKKAIFDREI